jgi:hypothetical protein
MVQEAGKRTLFTTSDEVMNFLENTTASEFDFGVSNAGLARVWNLDKIVLAL